MNDNDIKDAFERMGPSPEAEERMLAAILAENEALAARRTAPPKRRSLWKAALPLAACLALLAGVGAYALALYTEGFNPNLAAQPDQSVGLMETLSNENAEEKSAASPSDGSTSAANPAASYPLVELDDETVLRVASVGETESGEIEPLLADPSLVGEEIGPASARNENGTDSRACTVYAYPDERNPYAVRYAADSNLYLAALDPAHGETAG